MSEPGVHCQYFVSRKNRYCKMSVKEGECFCGEHLQQGIAVNNSSFTRIACPFDKKHSCYAHLLQKHLKKCNSRSSDNPDYIIPSKNRGNFQEHESRQKLTLSLVEDSYLLQLIKKIEATAKEHVPSISLEKHEHPILSDELSNPEYGISSRKHLLQNASLLGNLEQLGFLQSETCFIEFGAGRGQLSYWIGEAITKMHKTCILVPIDRANNRHKYDKRHRNEDNVIVERLRVDIADLDLGKVPAVKNAARVVAVCKHLCGVGIDLALRCITNSGLDNVKGIVMASCCHHRAEWESYIGFSFLQDHNFSRGDFELMCGMTSWATCGIASFKKHTDGQGFQRYSNMGITQEQRQQIGYKCKRLIDTGRLKYLNLQGFQCRFIEYVDQDICPENTCIVGQSLTSTSSHT